MTGPSPVDGQPAHVGTERVARALVHLYPRQFRSEFGDDVVQLAVDRRRHRGEPAWRLWPSLAIDTSSTALQLHWEEAMFPTRAVLIGTGVALVIFAALSGDPLVGLAVAVVIGVLVLATRRRIPAGSRGIPTSAAPWAVGGALFLGAAIVALIINGDDELSPGMWMALIGSMFVGMAGLATAAVLALEGRRHPKPVASV